MNEDSVTWDNVYSVGFDPIDNQHKELVIMINQLFDACKQGSEAADKVFLQTIKSAVKYARNHFADEEQFMLKADYPDLNDHRKLHDDFVATVLKSMQEFESGKTAPVEMARFLKNWLLSHIAKSDKQYAPYLAKL